MVKGKEVEDPQKSEITAVPKVHSFNSLQGAIKVLNEAQRSSKARTEKRSTQIGK